MGFLTHGPLHITALSVESSIEIEDLASALAGSRYVPETAPAQGWGSVQWQLENDAAPSILGSAVGEPSIQMVADRPILLARLVFDELNGGMRRQMGTEAFENLPTNAQYVRNAIDIEVIAEGQPDGSHSLLISSHDERDVGLVVAALRRSIDAADANPGDDDLVIGPDPTVVADDDLFLWLLHRWLNHHGVLDVDLSIVDFRTMSMRDLVGRVTRSLRGIDSQRSDVLAAVADGATFGPAKLVVADASLGLEADLFLLLDGTFDIHRGGTVYFESPMESGELGVRAAADVALGTIPRMLHARNADATWPNPERAKFHRDCRSELHRRYK